MDQDYLGSFLGSLCLHLGALALVLLWPSPMPDLRDDMPVKVVIGQITIGKEGKLNPKAKKAEPREAKAPTASSADNKPVETQPKTPPIEKPVPETKKPELKPVEKKDPVIDPNAVAIPKDTTKKPPVQNATKPETKTAEKPPAKNATKPKTESLADALSDLKKTTKDTGKGTKKGLAKGGAKGGKGSGDSLSQALSDLGSEYGGSGDDAAGNGPGGRGGDGIGLLGAYEDSVVSRVKPNWQWVDRADRKNYSAEVYVRIAADGTIQDVRIQRPSGNTLFDASIVRAVKATVNLEQPPKPEYQEMIIEFHSSMLSK